jgi:hypothetical protein
LDIADRHVPGSGHQPDELLAHAANAGISTLSDFVSTRAGVEAAVDAARQRQRRHLHLGSYLYFASLPAISVDLVSRPVTVTMANRKELARLETVPGAMRTAETGRLEEDVRRSMTVRD